MMRIAFAPVGRGYSPAMSAMTDPDTTDRLLVVAAEVPEPGMVRDAAGDDDVEVLIIAPALTDSAVRFWVSDVDDAIARARRIEEEAVEEARAEGLDAVGDVGESEPLQAAEDALATFPANRVLIVTHPEGEKAYGEEELDAARQRLGVPVRVQVASRE